MGLEKKFSELREKREGAYMAHVYYGDPTERFSLKQIKTLAENGADLIEFGIPFSDPTADGPTFQAACERALANGITPVKCIQGIKKLRDGGLNIPVVVTTYYNVPYVFGAKKFFKEIKRAGAQAIIVPDAPVEESGLLLEAGRETGIHVILLVTPTTTEERLKKIADAASGFIYVVNVEGVTGARKTLTAPTLKLVERVRRHTDIPLMAGFGISKREHAREVVSAGADGAITGSALGKIYAKKLDKPEDTLLQLAKFARQIKKGCNDGYRQRINY